jgi:NADH:ubiquinone oxidoreductase subunit 2 (subunit N)
MPGIIGWFLFFLRRWYRTTILVGVILSLFLALLAWQLPLEQTISIGPVSFKVVDTFSVLGRRFILSDSERPLLVLVYILAAFWFAGSYLARAGRSFVPLGMVALALWTAAIAVEPFLYAALLIEIAAFIYIPVLTPAGESTSPGVLRFLTFQTFGMLFILFTSWMLTGIEASPAELELAVRATFLLGFGFIFLLGIFPFHTWIPMLAESAHPYPVAFLLVMMLWIIPLFGVTFLERYAWLRTNPLVPELLRLGGVVTILVAGGWSIFQKKLSRMLGYAAMVETGFTLIALSLPAGVSYFFINLIPRTLAFGVWALAFSFLRQQVPAARLNLQGLARRMPFVCGSLVLAQFSIAGLPLLAGFSARSLIWRDLAEADLASAILAFIGSAGLLVAGIRSLAAMVMGKEESGWSVTERWEALTLLTIGVLALIAIGVFPQWFLPPISRLVNIFTRLSP